MDAPAGGIGLDYLYSFFQMQIFKIVFDYLVRGRVFVDGGYRGGGAAGGFESQGAAAGEGVQKSKTFDIAQDIKQRASDFLGHRVRPMTVRRLELLTLKLP